MERGSRRGSIGLDEWRSIEGVLGGVVGGVGPGIFNDFLGVLVLNIDSLVENTFCGSEFMGMPGGKQEIRERGVGMEGVLGECNRRKGMTWKRGKERGNVSYESRRERLSSRTLIVDPRNSAHLARGIVELNAVVVTIVPMVIVDRVAQSQLLQVTTLT